MTVLTRRSTLSGAATALAATTLTPFAPNAPASAFAPVAGKQAPGFYRYKVGDYEITIVNDGVWLRSLDPLPTPNVPVADLQKALADSFLPTTAVPYPFNLTIINTGSKLIAIDVGTGGRFSPTTAGTYLDNLTAAGIDPSKVDVVVISHFHPDHINGIWTKDDKAVFPNAEIMVPEPEWAFWMDDAKATSAPEGLKPNFANCKRVFGPLTSKVTRYQPGKEVAPGITSFAAYGHTPGHTAYTVSSGSASLLMIVDSVANPAVFARNPDWQHASDVDRNMGIETRKRMLDRAATDKSLIQAMHFPFPGAGHIVKDGNGYRFDPVSWTHLL
jgi:glyoxylase-like metal-dependent hydrolase (beta-lactamase superfamily II)